MSSDMLIVFPVYHAFLHCSHSYSLRIDNRDQSLDIACTLTYYTLNKIYFTPSNHFIDAMIRLYMYFHIL